LHHSDVFLLPYTSSAFSQYINPAKLYECLAVGKPTVATALPALQEYAKVIRIAANAAAFEQHTQDALSEGTNPIEISKRRACARANTWDVRFTEINSRIADRLLHIDGR
jgi:hypothetical protein